MFRAFIKWVIGPQWQARAIREENERLHLQIKNMERRIRDQRNHLRQWQDADTEGSIREGGLIEETIALRGVIETYEGLNDNLSAEVVDLTKRLRAATLPKRKSSGKGKRTS